MVQNFFQLKGVWFINTSDFFFVDLAISGGVFLGFASANNCMKLNNRDLVQCHKPVRITEVLPVGMGKSSIYFTKINEFVRHFSAHQGLAAKKVL